MAAVIAYIGMGLLGSALAEVAEVPGRRET